MNNDITKKQLEQLQHPLHGWRYTHLHILPDSNNLYSNNNSAYSTSLYVVETLDDIYQYLLLYNQHPQQLCRHDMRIGYEDEWYQGPRVNKLYEYICSYAMPEMNGFELPAHIMYDEEGRRLY